MMFGEYLRAIREQHCLSTRELSELIGVGQTQIVRWENMRGWPQPEKIRALAEVFEIPIINLLLPVRSDSVSGGRRAG